MTQVVEFLPRERQRHLLRCANCGHMSFKIAKPDTRSPLRVECANCEIEAAGIEVTDNN